MCVIFRFAIINYDPHFMKVKTHIFLFSFFFIVFIGVGQTCNSSFIFQYTGINNAVWFQDHSTSSDPSWQKDYTHWDFNDGTQDTGKALVHTFPQPTTYYVVKETKFSETGNPTNFCIAIDSLLIDASQSTSGNVCYPHVEFKVKWLTGLTYGVSSIITGCPYNWYEIVADTGSTAMGSTPIQGIYTTTQNYFTYTVPFPQFNNTITHHIVYPNSWNFDGEESSFQIWTLNVNHQTPTDCHAAFFIKPSNVNPNFWTIQDFSSGSAGLSYSWDFGDGNTSSQSTPTHTYSAAGIYTVCLTVSSGTCSDTYCDVALIDTTHAGFGMKVLNVQPGIVSNIKVNNQNESKLMLFPNPVKNSLTVAYPFLNSDFMMKVLDLLGQEVIIDQTEQTQTDQVKMNTEKLQSGIYFLRLSDPQGRLIVQKKFIKE